MGRFHELAVIRLFHVVGAYALEHIAEQIERPVSVRCCRTCGRTHQECVVGLRQQQCRHNADQCTEENQGSFAHHPRTFSPSLVAPPRTGSMGAPALRSRAFTIKFMFIADQKTVAADLIGFVAEPRALDLSRDYRQSAAAVGSFNASAAIAMPPYSLPAVQPRSCRQSRGCKGLRHPRWSGECSRRTRSCR
jgi:hypothetical protein